MLCKLADAAFVNPDYIWEPKFDGARIIAVVSAGKIRLFGRSGNEKTHLFPDLKIQTAKDIEAVLDGEVLSGSKFNDLQHRINRQNGIAQAVKDYPARYSVFDVLEVAGTDIKGFPLAKRKEILSSLLVETDNVTVTQYIQNGLALFASMKANQLEGVVGKSLQGTYREGKREWLKVKCWQEGMFIAVGYTVGTGWRAATFGALVLSDPQGKYVGSVGTGFNEQDLADLVKMFLPSSCPWPREPEPANWIRGVPVKVKFLELTNDGMLRFPSFKGVIDG